MLLILRSHINNLLTICNAISGLQVFVCLQIIKTIPYFCSILGRALIEADQVAAIVRSHIIENWAVQDEPPYLRMIRDR